jgi:hypothetical protein
MSGVSITGRDRKILWRRSGTAAPFAADRSSASARQSIPRPSLDTRLIIAAQSSGGSCYGECPPDWVDSYDYLILPCRYEDKEVDD